MILSMLSNINALMRWSLWSAGIDMLYKNTMNGSHAVLANVGTSILETYVTKTRACKLGH